MRVEGSFLYDEKPVLKPLQPMRAALGNHSYLYFLPKNSP
jgi:hypothetical protein